MAEVVDFEPFRDRLEKALKRLDGSKGGRAPYDPVLMFKVLVLQALYNLSDDQAEFQIRDRLSFMRFLGLSPNAPSPDAKTTLRQAQEGLWLFREHLVQARVIGKVFALFDARLKASGYLAQGGQIIDATVIAAPLRADSRACPRRRPANRFVAGFIGTPTMAFLRVARLDEESGRSVVALVGQPDGEPPLRLDAPAADDTGDGASRSESARSIAG